MGGVIYSDSADKAARFIMNCNQRKIPLVFLQDVSGFMVAAKPSMEVLLKTEPRWLMRWPTQQSLSLLLF
jgi:3-methylcrotonyl-CoA carboxylase beta subunit